MENMPSILSLDTSTSACSVALNVGDAIFQQMETGNNIHSQLLISMIEQVLFEAKLKKADLKAVAVGRGPGSFTGLRIGVGVAQGLAYGVGCPMLGLSSLEAIAIQTQISDGYVLAGLDARMNEIYWGLYKVKNGDTQLLGNLNVTSPTLISMQNICAHAGDIEIDKIFIAGNAWSVYQAEMEQTFFDKTEHLKDCVYPQAKDILELAQRSFEREEFISACEFSPQYVRNQVAFKKSV